MYRYGRHGRWPGQPTLLPLLLLGVSAYGMAAPLILQPTFLDDQAHHTRLEPWTNRSQTDLLVTRVKPRRGQMRAEWFAGDDQDEAKVCSSPA